MTHDEKLKLAREACASVHNGLVAVAYLEGRYDTDDAMRSTLAAIEATEKRIYEKLDRIAKDTPISRYGDEAILDAIQILKDTTHEG